MISSPFMPTDTTTLQMALIGYEAERQKIQAKIAELQRLLKIRNHRDGTAVDSAPVTRTRRRMSAAARKRIAEAQKKRWAEFHKKQKAA